MYLLITCELFLYVGLSRVGLSWIGPWSNAHFGRSRRVIPKAFLGTEEADLSWIGPWSNGHFGRSRRVVHMALPGTEEVGGRFKYHLLASML